MGGLCPPCRARGFALCRVSHGRGCAENAPGRDDGKGLRDATDPVRDQETTSLYGSVNHRVTREITASLLGQFQRGTFSGSAFDGDVENFLTLGLNVEYRINPNWAVDAGYNFDRLDSDVGRSFTRNRIYLGASATF